jgi:hypothetical protein
MEAFFRIFALMKRQKAHDLDEIEADIREKEKFVKF